MRRSVSPGGLIVSWGLLLSLFYLSRPVISLSVPAHRTSSPAAGSKYDCSRGRLPSTWIIVGRLVEAGDRGDIVSQGMGMIAAKGSGRLIIPSSVFKVADDNTALLSLQVEKLRALANCSSALGLSGDPVSVESPPSFSAACTHVLGVLITSRSWI